MSATIIIIEPQRDYREPLALALNHAPAFHCTGTYGDTFAAWPQLAGNPPDFVLYSITGRDPRELIDLARLRSLPGETRIVALFEQEEPGLIATALRAGACGYALKNSTPHHLVELLEEVLRGGTLISSQVARHLVDLVQGPPPVAPPQSGLSGREREILQYLALGYPYKQIADCLAISINTVRTYVRRLYAKLEVPCRTHAVLKYQRGVPPWPLAPAKQLLPTPAV